MFAGLKKDSVIHKITSCQGSEEAVRSMYQVVNKNSGLITKDPAHFLKALAAIDHKAQACGVALILAFTCRGFDKNTLPDEYQTFFRSTELMLESGMRFQLKIACKEVRAVIRKYTAVRMTMGTKMQMKALSVLKTACERLAPDKGVLTPAHPAFLQLCLMSNNFHLAQRLMQVPIYAVDKDTGMDVEDYLTYWYYAGIVQSALKQFRQAQNSFLQCIITPALAGSKIVVEAYKKFVLVSLLVDGEAPAPGKLPKYVSHPTKMCIQSDAYNSFSSTYTKTLRGEAVGDDHPIEQLRAIVTKFQKEFKQDTNLGLLDQCVKMWSRQKIKALTDTYLRRSLVDIAKVSGLESDAAAEANILLMIKRGEILATIDHSTGMVSFQQEMEESFDSHLSMMRLNREFQRVAKLAATVQTFDEQISTSKEYVKKIILKDQSGGMSIADSKMSDMDY